MSEEKTTTKARRRFTGVVTGTKMDKTAVVKVERTVIHPKYQKRYVRSAKFKIHDENNELKVGDKVIFEECRPLSKDKRWRLVEKVN